MNQNDDERQPDRGETPAHDGGRPGLISYVTENRVRDQRHFWITLLFGVALLLAVVYGFPHVVSLVGQ